MAHLPHRPLRRLVWAKRSASSQVRGSYRRAVHAARIRADETSRLERRPRAVASWVVVVACFPILLIAVVGAYAINVVHHAETAADRIAQPTLPRAPQVAAVTNSPRPTNTPDALGTIAPLPTEIPSPTATIDPIALVNFDRKDPFTMMLVGVDARDGQDGPPQSDTIILVYVDPLSRDDTIHLLSIPRDLRVTIAGGLGVGKMADVYALGANNHYLESPDHAGQGGLALVRDTIELNFRLQIDFYAQVDFNGFRKIIDTIGGVTVDNPYPIKDDEYPTEDYQFTRVYFPAGIMHLYGAEALQFARTRHDDNDYARNARQQQVLLGIRQQALQLNLLSKATSLIDTLGDSIRTDFPRDQWLPFAKFGTTIQGSAIRQFTLTDLLGDTTIDGIFYTTIDWTKAQQRAREFSPKENKDAIITQANSGLNRGVAVVVENGTRTAGIASTWASALRQQGYANTTFIDAPAGTKGNVPKTRILYFAADEQKTAQALATAMGLPITSVEGSAGRPPEAPTATILILLGNDAHAP
jgi:LCP family protein required for cell wall assembly